ncbi:hypothetical protein [Prevotella nigrescens]|uniref:hypothetical protein n=1 Tax=Prevotella nigrescens TaxID=28133 RepID=UPI00241FE271|nr:hypothetical protein [Prevotella nigrescens]
MANTNYTYQCNCPSLLRYETLYGQNSAAHWMTIQLAQLFFLSSSKDSSVADSIKQFASLLAVDVRHYKLSEIMLFFSRFAVGRYGGNSWQSFDLRRIGIAFHQEFLPERNLELARIEREQQQAMREQSK